MTTQITKEQRESALDSANKIQMRLYADPESGAELRKIADKHSAIFTDYKVFAIVVGDAILGLVPQEKLPDLLAEKLQITWSEAVKITADLLNFLEPLSNQNNQTSSSDILASDIAETEAALEAMPKNLPVTSAADQPSEQTKTASTPSIPIQQPATPPTPTFSQPPQPQHQETYRVPPSAPPTLAQSYRADKSASMRTMAEDMRAVHDQEPTYTSTQSAILRENRQPQPSKEPRWGED